MQKDNLVLSINDVFGDIYMYFGKPDLTLKPLRALTPLTVIIEKLLENGFQLSGEQHGFRIYICREPSEDLIKVVQNLQEVLQIIDKFILHGWEDEVAEQFSNWTTIETPSSLEDLKQRLYAVFFLKTIGETIS